MAFIDANKHEPSTISVWQDRNRHGLQEFWVASKGDALEIKRAVEAATTSMHQIAAE
jgi:hypothetical protein